jgi:hypothetical protein
MIRKHGSLVASLLALALGVFALLTAVDAYGAPAKAPAVSADMKPMPQYTSGAPQETWGKVIPRRPGKPDLLGGGGSEGLSKADVPKFFFGVGILVTIIGAVIKLALIAAAAFVAYHLIKKWRNPDVPIGTDDEPKDAIDTMIETVELAVARVRAAREKARAKLAKLDAGVDKLKKGITNAVTKE